MSSTAPAGATSQVISLIGRPLVDCTVPVAQALLTLAQREDIGGGLSLVVEALGIEAEVDSAGIVKSVHLHAEGHDGFRGFPLAIQQVGFGALRPDIEAAFGPAQESGGESKSAVLGPAGPWDAFVLGEVRLHFQYSPSERLEMVTLTQAVPRGFRPGFPATERG